jgi:predicted NAD-dependent protein-ADP-ribosyltransferase YbiA (DUF1768 family)
VLSQWYPALLTLDGNTYPTAEHWMMASKARLFGDRAIVPAIVAAELSVIEQRLYRMIAGTFSNETPVGGRVIFKCRRLRYEVTRTR